MRWLKSKWKPVLSLVATIGGAALLLSSLPGDELWLFGQKTALAAVGLQQPEHTLEWLSRQLQHQQAGPSPTLPATTAPSGTTTTGGDVSPPTTSPDPYGQIPPEDGTGGKVVEQTLSTGSNFVEGVAIKNRSGKTFDIASELKKRPDIHIKDIPEPQVLILHTHTTESFMPYYAGYYNAGEPARTTDESRNIVRVGAVIAQQLQEAGIGVIHDTTVHDYPKYTGAYTRSEQTAKAILEKYPTIQVVLDVHRDGIMQDNTTKVKPTTVIGGKKAAQVMIICGVNHTREIPHPNWQHNFHFALMLQQKLATSYQGLMRPLSLVASRYNQHLTKGSLLLEIGSEANTMEEAVYSAELVGKTLAELLKTLK